MSKANKLIVINGKVYSETAQKFETQNLLLINGIIMGYGYVPDDDDSTVIDTKGAYLVYDIHPLIKPLEKKLSFDDLHLLTNTFESYLESPYPKNFKLMEKANFMIVKIKDNSFDILQVFKDGQQVFNQTEQ